MGGRDAHHDHDHIAADADTPADAGAPAAVPDFAALGAIFNDATRALVGGLWQNALEKGSQGHGSVSRYIADLQTVQQGLQAEIEAGQFTGATLASVETMLNGITTAITAANASVNGGGAFGSIAAAEAALHDSHVAILNIVSGDETLAALATQNGADGFLAAPPVLVDGVMAASASQANLAEIAAIFNDLAHQLLASVNAEKALATSEVNAVITELQQIVSSPVPRATANSIIITSSMFGPK
jgi:hypothetical protein